MGQVDTFGQNGEDSQTCSLCAKTQVDYKLAIADTKSFLKPS